MAKKKRATRRSTGASTRSKKLSLNPSGFLSEARKPAMFLAGMFAGTQLANMLNRNVAPAVQGFLGLDGDSKQVVAPVVTAIAGLAISQMSSNQDVKMAGYGVAAVGGAYLAKNMLNVDVLPLRGLDGDEPGSLIPGFGEVTQIDLPLLDGGSEPEIKIEGAEIGTVTVIEDAVID